MSDNDFEKMMNFWKEGQQAFFQSQADVARQFGEAMAPKPKDPFTEGVEAWQNFGKAWAPGWDPSQFMSGKAFQSGRDAYWAMFDPSTWATQAPDQLRKIFENMTNLPQLADMYNPFVDVGSQWQEVLDYQEASRKFGEVMQAAWQRAYEAYAKSNSVEDLKSGNVQSALDAWLKTANEELLDTQATKDFMDAQRAMISASTSLTKRQAEWAEKWAESLQMPTRSEVDDLSKTVYELKKEIRKLKKELKAKK